MHPHLLLSEAVSDWVRLAVLEGVTSAVPDCVPVLLRLAPGEPVDVELAVWEGVWEAVVELEAVWLAVLLLLHVCVLVTVLLAV